jgi:hypothetical protein
MKIGIIVRCLCSGGTERVTAQLSCVLSNLGHDVVLLTQCTSMEVDFNHQCIARECATDGKSWQPHEICALQQKYGFDTCIFSGGWNDDFFNPAVQELKKRGVNVIAILHHVFNNWAFSMRNDSDFLKDDILPLIDCLVCVDKMQTMWWSRRHPCVVCINNTISITTGLTSEETGKLAMGEDGRIVWVGRPKDCGKRIEQAMVVFNRVVKRLESATLTVVGDIDETQKKVLIGMLDEKAQKRVSFTGYVPDARPHFEAANVSLVTTQWEVTVPQVVLEAQVLGIPTVALDLPVLRNVPGVYCALSIDDVAQKVVEILVGECDSLRKPYLDVSQWNCKVVEKWDLLLRAITDKSIGALAKDWMCEWRTVDNAELVLDEIQRGESFFVQKEFPRLKKLYLMKSRMNRILKFLGTGI